MLMKRNALLSGYNQEEWMVINEADKRADRDCIIIVIGVFITPVLIYILNIIWKWSGW